MAAAATGTAEACEEGTGPSSTEAAPPKLFVLTNGVAKKMNVGMIMRSACAFGAEVSHEARCTAPLLFLTACSQCLVVVGRGHKDHLQKFGAHGTDKHLPVKRFPRLQDAVDWAHEQGAKVVGVEITLDAKPVTDPAAFDGDTMLFLGEEGHGLTERQKELCDSFVYIPQFGSGTASLNVSVAASIAMHHFATYANYAERQRAEGLDKFLVEALPDPATLPRTEDELALAAKR